MAQDFPDAPPFDSVRLAKLEDVPRMGLVELRGFEHTQIFEFERPFYEQYPQDAYESMCELFHSLLADPNVVTLVVEDEYDSSECARNDPRESWSEHLVQPDHVVVGIGCWMFEEDSKRKGQFSSPEDELLRPIVSESERRDEIVARTELVDKRIEETSQEYFQGCNILTKLVVHPAYWRRGHGTLLMSWGKSLADMDGVDQGMMPSRMGEKIAFARVFEQITSVHVDGDDRDPEGIDVAVGIYCYKGR